MFPLLALLLSVPLGGCALFDDWGGGALEGECSFEDTLLDDTERAPMLGFSASDVLEWAAGERTMTARWNAPPTNISTNAPESETELSLQLTRGEGAASVSRCHAASIWVPVVVRMATRGGLLELDQPGVLSATGADFAQLRVELDFEDLEGSFAWRSEASGVELVQPTVTMTLTPDGASGQFDAIVQITSRDAVGSAGGSGPLLQWPAGSQCATDEVGVSVQQAPPLWREAIELAQVGPWSESAGEFIGQPIGVSIETSEELCQSLAWGTLLPVRVGVRTSDGLVDVVLAGALNERDGALHYEPRAPYPAGDASSFRERFGDFGQDLSPYESVQIDLSLELTGQAAAGSLAVLGGVSPCAGRDPSQGCGALRDEILVERSFRVTP